MDAPEEVQAVAVDLAWAGLAVLKLNLQLYTQTCGTPLDFDSVTRYLDRLRRGISRSLTGFQIFRSSISCESELSSCRQEEFLLEVVPDLFKAAFISAGQGFF